jgi:hypothetical protein
MTRPILIQRDGRKGTVITVATSRQKVADQILLQGYHSREPPRENELHRPPFRFLDLGLKVVDASCLL